MRTKKKPEPAPASPAPAKPSVAAPRYADDGERKGAEELTRHSATAAPRHLDGRITDRIAGGDPGWRCDGYPQFSCGSSARDETRRYELRRRHYRTGEFAAEHERGRRRGRRHTCSRNHRERDAKTGRRDHWHGGRRWQCRTWSRGKGTGQLCRRRHHGRRDSQWRSRDRRRGCGSDESVERRCSCRRFRCGCWSSRVPASRRLSHNTRTRWRTHPRPAQRVAHQHGSRRARVGRFAPPHKGGRLPSRRSRGSHRACAGRWQQGDRGQRSSW